MEPLEDMLDVARKLMEIIQSLTRKVELVEERMTQCEKHMYDLASMLKIMDRQMNLHHLK